MTPLYTFLKYCENSKLKKEILDCGAGGKNPPLYIFHLFGYKTHGVDISEEQVRKAQPIIEESIKERRTIIQKYKANDRPDFYSLRGEIRELQGSVEKHLAQILTVKQMQKYLDIQKEERRKVRSEKRRRNSMY